MRISSARWTTLLARGTSHITSRTRQWIRALAAKKRAALALSNTQPRLYRTAASRPASRSVSSSACHHTAATACHRLASQSARA
jgi:hypothetical protein